MDNPEDFVRTEIRAALQRDIIVIPVLVENATMPSIKDLPEDIQMLARRYAIDISPSRFNIDLERLFKRLQGVLTYSFFDDFR